MEKVAMTPHKSAYQLAMEASKYFEKEFDDFNITAYERNGDKLKITASTLLNNSSYFNVYEADIVDEKVCNIKFKKQTQSNKINRSKQKRLSYKNIISKSYVNTLLKENGFFNVNINEMFNSLTKKGLLNPINEDKYASQNMTIDDLLNQSKEYLGNCDKDKYNKLIDKVNNLKFEREEVKDTGVREDIKFSKEYRLATLNNYLSQKFIKFSINNFTQLDNDNYEADVVFNDNGVKRKLHIYTNYSGTKLNEVKAKLQNKKVSIKDATSLFNKTTSLNKYLNKNASNIFTDKIVLTLDQIYNKLNNFVDINVIDDIISDWIDNGYIINIGGDTYTSNYTFEDLLQNSNINILSDEEIDDLVEMMLKIPVLEKLKSMFPIKH
jgi:hypothetical protein